jgi:endo-1,4-beta-mannosidase
MRLHGIAPWHAILQNDACDAQRVQVVGDLRAFVLDGEDVVAAAGANQDRCAICFSGFIDGK